MPNLLAKKYIYEHRRSVIWLLVTLTASVFIAEAAVMLFLNMFPNMPEIVSTLMDSALLSALLFPAYYFLIFRPLLLNIAERQQAEAELRIAAVALEIRDPILITDADANIIRANKKFLYITGYSEEELIGKNPRIFQSGRNNKVFYEALWQQLLRTGSWSGGTYLKNKNGNVNVCWLTITAVKNEQQKITHYVGIYNNG